MDKKLWVFLLSVGLFGVSLFSRGDTGSASVKKSGFSYPVDDDSVEVFFFYGEGCPHCADVQPFLAEMEKRYRLNLQRFDIYTNRSHISLFDEFSDDYGLPYGRRGVPAVFISGTYFVGDTMILEGLEDVIEEAIFETTSVESVEVAEDSMEAQAANEDDRESCGSKSPNDLDCLSLWTITGAALVDSVSPCSIAILVFLIGARALVGNQNKRALKVGLSFCLAVFVAYLLFGLGLLTVLQVSGFAHTFSLLVGSIALLTGILYLKEAFGYGKGRLAMEVPRSLKPSLMKMLKGVTSPFGAFAMGFVAVLFELPCTGGPYLFILGQLADATTRLQTIPLLLYYNLIFVSPLIIISLLLYSNLLVIGKARVWNAKNKHLLKTIGGLAMIIMGFSVIPIPQILSVTQHLLNIYRMPSFLAISFFLLYQLIIHMENSNNKKRLARYSGQSLLLAFTVIPLLLIPVHPATAFNPDFIYAFSEEDLISHSPTLNDGSVTPKEGEVPVSEMPNPAAVYCMNLGYDYRIDKTLEGETGVCVFPDGSECEEWSFLQGRCGQQYSYCIKHGYDMETRTDGKNPYSNPYSVCVPKETGKEEMTVTDSLELGTELSTGTVVEEADVVSGASLPDVFDWRDVNGSDWMTPVKNQGRYCGSCWAFAAVGTVEAQFNIELDEPDLDLDLSEQQLVSNDGVCCERCGGCGGGSSFGALGYINDTGIVDEACFSYTGNDSTPCSKMCSDWENRLYRIHDFEGNANKEKLVEHGPILSSIFMDGYFDENGIYKCDAAFGNLHAIVITGYNDSGGYWMAKNSWGNKWNGDGYFRVYYDNCSISPSNTVHVDPDIPVIPKIDVTSPRNDEHYYKQYVSLEFEINKPADWIGYSLDGEMDITIPGPIALSGISDGYHDVVVKADIEGNIVESETIYFYYLGGDVNQDRIVDLIDIAIAAQTFGSSPEHPRWNSQYDINEDSEVNLTDLLFIARNFGTH